jgi:hypothetical protein
MLATLPILVFILLE